MELSLTDRLQRMFYEPSTAFTAVLGRERSQDWLVPVCLIIFVGLIAHFMTADIDKYTPELERLLAALPESERDEAVAQMARYRWLDIPIYAFQQLVIVSAVLMLMARSVFKSEVTFQQMLIVKAYASMVVVPEWIVQTALMLSKGSVDIHVGPGALVSAETASTYAGRLLADISLFEIWQCWLLGVGLSILGEVPIKRAIVSVFLLWGLWVIAGNAVELVSSVLPPPETTAVPEQPIKTR